MTTAEFSTVLDSIIDAAFTLACAMPATQESARLHEVASIAKAAQDRIEAELEEMHFAEMARRWEEAQDARYDAISAHWGHD